MKIASLLSSATEIIYELGLQDSLVAISHECDWPPEALRLPRLSRSRFDPEGLNAGEIDAEVRRCMAEFGNVYQVDAERLADVEPDVILTQAVCEVCAVPTGAVEEAVSAVAAPPRVLSLDAHTLGGIFTTLRQVADAAGKSEAGDEAIARLEDRIGRVHDAVAGRRRPRTLLLEWLDPPFTPGHWVPEMIELAGGENLVGEAGGRSDQTEWEALEGLNPDVLLLAPCGWNLDQAADDAERHRGRLEGIAGRAIESGRAYVLHGSYFSRSGPRVVGGIEALGSVLHPDRLPADSMEGRARRWG